MADIQENVIEWITGDAYISVTVTQERYRNKLRKLYAERPEQFQLFREDDNGYVFAKIPATWIKVGPPRKVDMTEEKLQKLADARARRFGNSIT